MHIKQVTLPSRSKALVRMTDGSVAELPGELGLHGFLANAKDVKWIEPEDRRDRPVNDAEMKLIAEAIEENNPRERNEEHRIVFDHYDLDPNWGFSASGKHVEVRGNLYHVDISCNGRTMRIDGFRDFGGFTAEMPSAHWLPPHQNEPLTPEDAERYAAEALIAFRKNRDFKLSFANCNRFLTVKRSLFRYRCVWKPC